MSWLDQVKFGDVATWIAGLSTLAAFVAAVRAGFWARDIVNIERDRDERQAAETKARQASQIAAWAEPSVIKPVRGDSSGFHFLYTHVAVDGLVANRSNQPIYRVRLGWHKEGKLLQVDECPVIAPGVDGKWALEEQTILEIAGVPDEQVVNSLYLFEQANELSRLAVAKILLDVKFTDSSNRCWHRDIYGELHELSIRRSPTEEVN